MNRKLKRLEEQQRKLMEEIERNNRRIDPDGKRNDKSGLISFLTAYIAGRRTFLGISVNQSNFSVGFVLSSGIMGYA